MAFFDSFTDSLKQKWLQFFQANHDWISLHMQVESVYTPDGGRRPSSYLILGVLNALEPKLAQLMLPFSKLNPDADTLIEVLDLNFDPDVALGNRFIPREESELYHHQSTALADHNPEDETLSYEDSEDYEATVAIEDVNFDQQDSAANELDELEQIPSLDTVDEFGEVSFDAVTVIAEENIVIEENIIEELNAPDENAFSDVLSDVWGDETSLVKEEGNNEFLGEELPNGVFDDSEIARLFPNN